MRAQARRWHRRALVPARLRLRVAWLSVGGWFSAHVAGESVAQRTAGLGAVSPWVGSRRSFWSLAPFTGGKKGWDEVLLSEEHRGRPRAEGTRRVWAAAASLTEAGVARDQSRDWMLQGGGKRQPGEICGKFKFCERPAFLLLGKVVFL